ncbi:TKL/LISK/LISK-DD1 protein kinase [Saprolegnia parasitica CBS 223.65]|uniref:TKL/LISK/LISK-DD1 protein kinase n=1 Tax=Saprolegnia parasitica (strain CBS 223.65) TaxID=695850 RepID=A0A067C0K4_SAPPC|nr:TKL/LISK/LISK-DD1 protein kinase [Saprolegnia parasitica CBS 223.65]KDO24299.1 TKL/LISK/LISK-DD1 protein kinase [Saprolegnia parasitica CBS 223.65]|eukprot:XP_012205069.1 TKL/LISK/LISK-DD1 protein kinase [Saprolegnia parasitica CBS 223.65]
MAFSLGLLLLWTASVTGVAHDPEVATLLGPGGKRLGLTLDFLLPILPNDWLADKALMNTPMITGVEVSPGYEFVGYAYTRFTGNYMVWNETQRSLGPIWSGRIRSFIVREVSHELSTINKKAQEVGAVYTDLNFSGQSRPINLFSTSWKVEGYFESVRLSPGYMLTISDGLGNSETWKTDFDVPDKWKKSAVAFRLQSLRALPKPTTVPTRTDAPTTSVPTTPTPTPSTLGSSETNQVPLILGSVGGTLALVAVVVGIYCLCRRRKRRPLSTKLDTPNVGTPQGPSTYAATSSLSPRETLDLQALYKYRIDPGALVLHETLGFGAFAQVWRATCFGLPVAVKTLLAHRQTARDIAAFIKELELLSSFHSPYIVEFVGVVWTTPSDIKGVMELMDDGDLRTRLATTSPATLPWSIKVGILRHVVDGLAYLHSLHVIHRDLKSRNILLDRIKGAKLVDFGVARDADDASMTMGVGTYRWMAPEVLHGRDYSVAADIYSLGMVLTELDSHAIPFQHMARMSDVALMCAVMNGSVCPTAFTPSCPDWLKHLATLCTSHDPNERPTIYQVQNALQAVRV